MAQPFDALAFREIFGRSLRNPDRAYDLAFAVTPFQEGEPDRDRAAKIASIIHNLREIVDHSEIYYVSREITEMLLKVSDEMPDTKLMHFDQGDWPTRTGLVYFDGMVDVPTIYTRSGQQPLRALLWGQLATEDAETRSYLIPGSYSDDIKTRVIGKIVYSIVDTPSMEQFKDRRIRQSREHIMSLGKWTTRHWIPIEYGVRYDGNLITIKSGEQREEWVDEVLTPEEREQDRIDSRVALARIFKLLYVWTNFLQTEILGHAHFDSSQHDKVVAREGRPPAKIRVVTLRRYAASGDLNHNQVDVNWQYRWKVREHYRNQRVGPGRAFIRRVLIREHVKGPPDKPLADQETIQAIVR
jgi:hypothetical protein